MSFLEMAGLVSSLPLLPASTTQGLSSAQQPQSPLKSQCVSPMLETFQRLPMSFRKSQARGGPGVVNDPISRDPSSLPHLTSLCASRSTGSCGSGTFQVPPVSGPGTDTCTAPPPHSLALYSKATFSLSPVLVTLFKLVPPLSTKFPIHLF